MRDDLKVDHEISIEQQQTCYLLTLLQLYTCRALQVFSNTHIHTPSYE